MAKKSSNPQPKWLIDLPGMVEALRSRSNARARVIDAIESGEMLIQRDVSDRIKDSYSDLWEDFKAIEKRKYKAPTVADDAFAQSLIETYSGKASSGMPTYSQFQNAALAKKLKCRLISAGNSLKNCKDIAAKCKLGADLVGSISDV